jgi:hypothetical protein
MKTFFTFIFLLFLTLNSVLGQQLQVSTDSVIVYGFSNQHEVVGYATVTNNSDRDITVVWERIVNNTPSAWLGTGSQVCDINLCWVDTVNSRDFVLPANSSGNIDVHFTNNFEAGDATVQIRLYETGADSADSETIVVYKAFVDVYSSVWDKPNLERDNFRIYPNPVRDHLMFKKLPDVVASTVEIYNILGSKMSSHHLSKNQHNLRIDMDDLPKGIYMVRVYDEEHKLVYSKSISKVE